MSNGLCFTASRRQRQCWNSGPRILFASLALALAAAACGGAETAAPEPAATTTAAPAETTTPTTEPPAPTTTKSLEERCASAGAGLAEQLAVEARELMAASPSGLGLQRLTDLRARAGLTAGARTLGCASGWTADDEARYQAILAAAAEEVEDDDAEPVDETAGETADETGAGDDGPEAEQGPPEPVEPVEQAPAAPAPDDPEWVDELPEPADPDPAPVGAELVWPVAELRPVAEARPFICDNQPWRCEPGGPWVREPVAIAVGTRIVIPGDPGLLNVQEITVPDGTGGELRLRVTDYPAVYRYTVTGFAPEAAPGAGGLLDVRVLWHETVERREVTEWIDQGRSDEETTGGERNSSIWGTVLPEHADTVVYDDDGNMTAATLLLFDAPPAAAGN